MLRYIASLLHQASELSTVTNWCSGKFRGGSERLLPLLTGLYFIPGFAPAFWESIYQLFEQKSTNLPLPIPWPWLTQFKHQEIFTSAREILTGTFFIALPTLPLLVAAWIARNKHNINRTHSVLIASALMSVPYMHYAYSRADIGHLAQGIFPLLIGIMAVAAKSTQPVRFGIIAGLCVSSAIVTLPMQPGWVARGEEGWKNIVVGQDKLLVDPGTAANHKLLITLAEQYAPNGRTFIAVPNWPGAYAALERKSPMWEIYPLFSRKPVFEEKEIERIRSSNPGFAVVMDLALDGRDELRFRNTHPLIERYIRDHFIPIDNTNINSNLTTYKAAD